LSNLQPSDAGVYDVEVLGNNWFISPKTFVSAQTSNGPGLFQNPRVNGSNFISDFIGAQGRAYRIQWSSNLTSWADLPILTNTTGTAIFTNSMPAAKTAFYRALLLP